MNIDELIKSAYEKESESLNLSLNSHDEMLKYIEEQATLKKNHLSLITKTQELISKINYRDFMAVAAFIFILVAIPIAAKSYKNSSKTKLPASKPVKQTVTVNKTSEEKTNLQVNGPGIIATLVQDEGKKYVSEKHFTSTINVLIDSSAKAISINDYPITNQSIIKVDNKSNCLLVDNKTFNLHDEIIIKAIGLKYKLQDSLSHSEAFQELCSPSYSYLINIELKDLISISSLYNANSKVSETPPPINNSTLDYETAIKNGDVAMISLGNSISSKTNNDTEIYNINNLDNFIKNCKKGKKGEIRIVKYAKEDSKTWVNKLSDLEYDGRGFMLTEYDVYSDKNKFTPVQSDYFAKIGKSDPQDGIRYFLCRNINDLNKDGMNIISFSKNIIVK